jgi:hypothetical protein
MEERTDGTVAPEMNSSREFKGETGERNPLDQTMVFQKTVFSRICVLREGTYRGDF